MPRIVDLTLPVVSGMAGIPNIPLYEKYPVTVQAVTVVSDEQRPLLAREGVDLMAEAPATGTMNTVLTLNTHIGTHIDAPRHFLADGGAVDQWPLDRLVMRDAVVLDVLGPELERAAVEPDHPGAAMQATRQAASHPAAQAGEQHRRLVRRRRRVLVRRARSVEARTRIQARRAAAGAGSAGGSAAAGHADL